MEVATRLEIVGLGDLIAIGAFAGGQIGFASDDRLDPVLAGLHEEFDRAEHVAMVGHGDGGHAGGFGVFDQRADFVGAVEQTVLRMNVKMDETHRGGLNLLPTPQPNQRRKPSAMRSTFA